MRRIGSVLVGAVVVLAGMVVATPVASAAEPSVLQGEERPAAPERELTSERVSPREVSQATGVPLARLAGECTWWQAKTPAYNVGSLKEDRWYQYACVRQQADGTGGVLEAYFTEGGICDEYEALPGALDLMQAFSQKTGGLELQWGNAGGSLWPLDERAGCGENFVGGINNEPEQVKYAGRCLTINLHILEIYIDNWVDVSFASWRWGGVCWPL